MKHHILVVDDEAPIRDLLASYFAKHGFQVSSTGTAEGALRMAKESNPNLILLDIVLPDADGLDLLGTLRKELPELMIVVMTGMGLDDNLIKQAKSKGAAGFVSKTAPLDKLLSEVQSILADS